MPPLHSVLVSLRARKAGLLAAVSAAFALAGAAPALGATITVTSGANVAGGGACTLPNAITAANTDATAGGCSAGSGTDTINVTYTGVIDLGTGDATELPAISTPMTIDGPGVSQLTVGSSTDYGLTNQRVFTLAAGATTSPGVTIKDLTVRGGNKVAGANGSGGGVLVPASTGLTLDTVRVTGNRVSAGATAASFGGGVGIANSGGATALVTIINSTIDNNIAGANSGDGSGLTGRGIGGGVAGPGASAGISITGSTIANNEVRSTDNTNASSGGGIYTSSGPLSVISSVIDGNRAFNPNTTSSIGPGGAGVFHNGTTFTLTGSTVSNNQSIGNAGGASIATAGGVFVSGSSAVLTMSNSTVSGNQAMSSGGGMELAGSTATATTITNSTIANNVTTAGATSPAARTGTPGINMNTTRVVMNNVTISGNQNTQSGNTFAAGISFVGTTNFTATNTVIAGNGNPSGALDCRIAFGSPTISFASYDLVGALGAGGTSCPYVADATTHNVALGQSPLLGTLANNGSVTQTMKPLLGSPLLGAGNPAAPGAAPACSATGQNGITRAQHGAATPGSGCDIGAYAAPRRTLTVTNVAPGGSSGVLDGPTGDGQISCGTSCTGEFPENAQVTLTASPASPSVFGSWSGVTGTTCASTSLTCVVPMTAAQSVTATFATPPALTTASLPAGAVDASYSHSLTASGTNTPITFALSGSGTVPAGLTLHTDGSVTGTPTAYGTYTFGVTVTDSNGNTSTSNVTLSVSTPAPTLDGKGLADATAGSAYEATVAASGGAAPVTYAVTGGALPEGLALDPATGRISGTPAQAGQATFTVTATDAASSTVSAAFTINVLPAPATGEKPGGTTPPAPSPSPSPGRPAPGQPATEPVSVPADTVAKGLTVTEGGAVRFPLSCPASVSGCDADGTLSIAVPAKAKAKGARAAATKETVLARFRGVKIAAGKSALVAVKLDPKALQSLRAKGVRRVRVTLRTNNHLAGGATIANVQHVWLAIPRICATTSTLRVHWAIPRGTAVRSIVITVNGKVVRRLRADARAATLRFAAGAPSAQKVTVTATTATGGKLATSRLRLLCGGRKPAGYVRSKTIVLKPVPAR